MYATCNPKTKKELKMLVNGRRAECAASGARFTGVAAHQPGPFGPDVPDGWHCCEGPHYPEPHRWYAQVRVINGHIVEVK
jgi:hypothetical protein